MSIFFYTSHPITVFTRVHDDPQTKKVNEERHIGIENSTYSYLMADQVHKFYF